MRWADMIDSDDEDCELTSTHTDEDGDSGLELCKANTVHRAHMYQRISQKNAVDTVTSFVRQQGGRVFVDRLNISMPILSTSTSTSTHH